MSTFTGIPAIDSSSPPTTEKIDQLATWTDFDE
jgi:hypothetical protein